MAHVWTLEDRIAVGARRADKQAVISQIWRPRRFRTPCLPRTQGFSPNQTHMSPYKFRHKRITFITPYNLLLTLYSERLLIDWTTAVNQSVLTSSPLTHGNTRASRQWQHIVFCFCWRPLGQHLFQKTHVKNNYKCIPLNHTCKFWVSRKYLNRNACYPMLTW